MRSNIRWGACVTSKRLDELLATLTDEKQRVIALTAYQPERRCNLSVHWKPVSPATRRPSMQTHKISEILPDTFVGLLNRGLLLLAVKPVSHDCRPKANRTVEQQGIPAAALAVPIGSHSAYSDAGPRAPLRRPELPIL